jgi:hypothetical protein
MPISLRKRGSRKRGEAGLNRNLLNCNPGDLLSPTVVKPRGARIGVAGKVLDAFKGDALRQQIGDGDDYCVPSDWKSPSLRVATAPARAAV